MYFRYGDERWDAAEPPQGGGTGEGHDRRGGDLPGAEARLNAGRAAQRFPTVDLRGVRVHAVAEADCVSHILSELDAGRGGMVVTPNLDPLHRCLHDLTFAALVSEADLVVAD